MLHQARQVIAQVKQLKREMRKDDLPQFQHLNQLKGSGHEKLSYVFNINKMLQPAYTL